jgi:ketosteroid isomerase-like protein
MSESSVETVRLLFERLEAGGLEAAIDLIAEDFVATVPPSMSAEPDVYEGHNGMRRYYAGFDGLIEDLRFEPLEIVEEGEVVIASMRFSGRGVTSGIEVTQHAAVIVGLRDGKVTRMDAHPDMDAARAALAG